MKYSDVLKNYLKKSGLTLDQISEKLKEYNLSATPHYLSRLQNGRVPPASDELNRALAEITEGELNKLVIAAQMDRLNPILDDLGEKGFNEFLNSVIGHMVTRDHFVKDFNTRLSQQCMLEGKPFVPMNKEEIKEHFSKVSMDEKLMLSQFFTYSFDKENKTYTVLPYQEQKLPQDITHEISLSEYKRVYDSLLSDERPPDNDELLVLRIALQTYRMGKNLRKKN